MCGSHILFLYRHSRLLDTNCRRILCSSLIQPYMDYCCSSWYSGLTGRLRDRLDVLQRRMVRYIFGYGPRQHVGSDDVKALSWLLVKDRVRYFKLVHVFKVVHGRAPSYLMGLFVPITGTHSHDTRSSSYNFHVSKALSHLPQLASPIHPWRIGMISLFLLKLLNRKRSLNENCEIISRFHTDMIETQTDYSQNSIAIVLNFSHNVILL